MKTVIHEGITATVHVTISGSEEKINLDFQVLPQVGDIITVGRHGEYFNTNHKVVMIQHQVTITDSANHVYPHIHTEVVEL